MNTRSYGGALVFQSDRTVMPQLFSFTVRDLIPPDSDAWLFEDVFDALDLEEFDWDYSSQGQAAKHPRLMLRTIFYGLCHGISSGRALTVACRSDVRFMMLCGETRPDARTFHRFVLRHQKKMPALFEQVVQLAMKMGLARMGRIAIDGSRFKANTSKSKAMSYGRMKAAVETLKNELKDLRKDLKKLNKGERDFSELPEELERKEKRLARIEAAKEKLETEKGESIRESDQKSFNDHDALPMAGKGKGFEYGYNMQLAVDEDSQIIVGATVHGSQADAGAVADILEQAKQNTGDVPDEVLADKGYQSAKDLQSIEEQGATPYVACGKGEDSSAETVDDQLTPGEGPHDYKCLAGHTLETTRKCSNGRTVVSSNQSNCADCPLKNQCQLNKKSGKEYTIRRREEWLRVQRNRQRMATSAGQGVYRHRKAIVEPVFGNIKTKGLQIRVKGKEKVENWWTMVCLALNLEKIVGHLRVLFAKERPKRSIFSVGLKESVHNLILPLEYGDRGQFHFGKPDLFETVPAA